MSDLNVEQSDGVLTLTLNRPDRLNALSSSLAVEIYEGLQKAADDPSVRVVVLTGTGRGFCAGADLQREKQAESEGKTESLLDVANRSIQLITELPKPVVAAVNGVAAGIGVSYALASDVVVAKESASFLLAFSRIGLMPDGGATLLVPSAMGRARAMDMALLADQIPAKQAQEWGLISRVASDDEYDAELKSVVDRLANGPTMAYSQTKAAINATTKDLLKDALEREVRGQGALGKTFDNKEGVTAFLEKRPAKFEGR